MSTDQDYINYDYDYVTGRKLIITERKEMTILSETGTVEYNGLLLKKVNTAIINKKRTTYFKCRNMRTPYHVTGVCNFSGRIVNFPDNLEMEIIRDHSSGCCFVKGVKANNEKIEKNIIQKTSVNKNNKNSDDNKNASRSSKRNKNSMKREIYQIFRDQKNINKVLKRKTNRGLNKNSTMSNNTIIVPTLDINTYNEHDFFSLKDIDNYNFDEVFNLPDICIQLHMEEDEVKEKENRGNIFELLPDNCFI